MSWYMHHTFNSAAGNQYAPSVNGLTEAFQSFYNNETDFSGLPDFLNPNSSGMESVSNYITAAITFAEWLSAQRAGFDGPGTSSDNPYEVPLTTSQKQTLVQNLGNDADHVLANYHSTAKFDPAIGNTYFELNSDPRYGGVNWTDDGELQIYDVYNFAGWGDFGAFADLRGGPGVIVKGIFKFIAVGLVARIAAAPAVIVRSVMTQFGFNPNTGEFHDGESIDLYTGDNLPFTIWQRDHLTIGNVRNLYIRNTFTPEQICEWNKPLFQDAVGKGYIKLDETVAGSCERIGDAPECFDGTDAVIEVGQAQPIPLLGFPYYPPNVSQISEPVTYSSFQYGASNRYPSPFTSFQQQIVNNTNYLGAYAMYGDISGRVRLILSGEGPGFGEPAFVAQCWDEFDDGPNNVDGNGVQYPSKKEWWDTCKKVKLPMRNRLFTNNPLTHDIYVAVKSYDGPGDDDVWQPSYNISQSPFGTVSLSGLIALASAVTGLLL